MQLHIAIVEIVFLSEILALVSGAPPDVVSATNGPAQFGAPVIEAPVGYFQEGSGDYGVPQQQGVGSQGGDYGTEPQGNFGGPQGYNGGPQGYVGGPQYIGGPQGYVGGPQGYVGGPQGYVGGPQGYNGGPQEYREGPGYQQGYGPYSRYDIGDIRRYLIRYPNNPFMNPF